jgi:hypothetical protein
MLAYNPLVKFVASLDAIRNVDQPFPRKPSVNGFSSGLAPQMKQQLPKQMSSTKRCALKKITFPALSMIEPSSVTYAIDL